MRLFTGKLEDLGDDEWLYRIAAGDYTAYFPVTVPFSAIELRASPDSLTTTTWDIVLSWYQGGDTLLKLVPSTTVSPANVFQGCRTIGLVDMSAYPDGTEYVVTGLDFAPDPNATARRLRLTRYGSVRVNFTYLGAYRMRIEVSEVEGPDLDPYVFIYRQGPLNPYTGETCDEFLAVAGPADLADIPALAPDPERNWPFYRLDYFENDYRSEELATNVWEIVQQEVQILVTGMSTLLNLEALESLVITGSEAVPDTPNSESASESTSAG